MAQAPKLTPGEWGSARQTWEQDDREGFAWLVRELGLPVTPPAVRKKGVAQRWRKTSTGRQVLKRPPSAYQPRQAPLASDESEYKFQQRFAKSLASGEASKRYGWPPVVNVITEYRVGRTACDAVAFHTDGSLTVCELKRAGLSTRDCMTGIGQLVSASVQIGLALLSQGARRSVRLALVIPGEPEDTVGYACVMAGIEYLPFDADWPAREAAIALVAEMKGEAPRNG